MPGCSLSSIAQLPWTSSDSSTKSQIAFIRLWRVFQKHGDTCFSVSSYQLSQLPKTCGSRKEAWTTGLGLKVRKEETSRAHRECPSPPRLARVDSLASLSGEKNAFMF